MARAAVEKVEHVESVQTDMNEHTVTVTFDDDKTGLDAIVAALNDAGYVVKSEQKIE
jgi:copper chaperone CopZ